MFCKFNDPLYLKLEKIEVLVKVVQDSNCESVLNELADYANDMDMDLVQAAVKTIGQIILKIQSSKAVSFAVSIIQQIVQGGQPVALQEAVVVARDIFRKFPNKHEKLVKDLVEKVAECHEPDARAAIAWIVGEHCEKIKKVQELF